MSDLVERLHCPFCASPALPTAFNAEFSQWEVKCSDCDCIQTSTASADEAVALWNYRYPDPEISRLTREVWALRTQLRVATDALEGLSYIHDGNPSDAMADTPPLEYARHMLYEARQIAKEAVREIIAIRNERPRAGGGK